MINTSLIAKTSYLGFAARLLGSGFLLFFVFRAMDTRGIAAVFASEVRIIFLVVAFILYGTTQILAVRKWYTMSTTLFGLPRKFALYVRLFFVGIFYAHFLPGGQLVGEGVKAYRMAGLSLPAHRVIASQILDRITGFIALGILATLAYGMSPIIYNNTSQFFVVCGILIATAVGIAIVVMPRMFSALPWVSNLLPQDSAVIAQHKYVAWYAIGFGAVIHLLSSVVVVLVFFGLGVAVPFWLAVWVYLVAGIGIAVPISYAGLGVREGIFAYYFTQVGVAPEFAVSAALLVLFIQFASACIGGFAELATLWKK